MLPSGKVTALPTLVKENNDANAKSMVFPAIRFWHRRQMFDLPGQALKLRITSYHCFVSSNICIRIIAGRDHGWKIILQHHIVQLFYRFTIQNQDLLCISYSHRLFHCMTKTGRSPTRPSKKYFSLIKFKCALNVLPWLEQQEEMTLNSAKTLSAPEAVREKRDKCQKEK